MAKNNTRNKAIESVSGFSKIEKIDDTEVGKVFQESEMPKTVVVKVDSRGEDNTTTTVETPYLDKLQKMIQSSYYQGKKETVYFGVGTDFTEEIDEFIREYNYKLKKKLKRNDILRAFFEDFAHKNINKMMDDLKKL